MYRYNSASSSLVGLGTQLTINSTVGFTPLNFSFVAAWLLLRLGGKRSTSHGTSAHQPRAQNLRTLTTRMSVLFELIPTSRPTSPIPRSSLMRASCYASRNGVLHQQPLARSLRQRIMAGLSGDGLAKTSRMASGRSASALGARSDPNPMRAMRVAPWPSRNLAAAMPTMGLELQQLWQLIQFLLLASLLLLLSSLLRQRA